VIEQEQLRQRLSTISLAPNLTLPCNLHSSILRLS
jgi:hypothetical protein